MESPFNERRPVFVNDVQILVHLSSDLNEGMDFGDKANINHENRIKPLNH